MGLNVTFLICVLVPLPHFVFDWLWYCLSVFSWFFVMLHWIDCGIVNLCSHWSSSCSIVLIVTVFICVLLFFPFLHWIDSDIICLCSCGSSSCCIGLIVTLLICDLVAHPHVVFDWLRYCFSVFSWFFLMLHWINCGIVYLCSHWFSSCCIVLIVTVFICVLMVLLMLHWINCDIVKLCFHGSTSCCLGLIVTLFVFVLVVLPHVALDSLLHCLFLFLWFFLMLHWIDCGSVICILLFFSFFALDWLWHCLSVFLWFVLLLHWFDSDIVCLCSCGSSSCCIGLILTLLICVLVAHPYVVFDWLWYCLSVFSWFFLMLHWIDCGIVYLF